MYTKTFTKEILQTDVEPHMRLHVSLMVKLFKTNRQKYPSQLNPVPNIGERSPTHKTHTSVRGFSGGSRFERSCRLSQRMHEDGEREKTNIRIRPSGGLTVSIQIRPSGGLYRRSSRVQGSGWTGVSDPIGALGRAGGRWSRTSGSGVFRRRWRTGCPASWNFPVAGFFPAGKPTPTGVGLRDPTGSLMDAQRRRARENKDPDPTVGGSLSRSRRLSGVQGSGWMGVSDPIGALGRAGGRWLGTSGSGVFRSRWRISCPASWIFPGDGHFRGCGFFFF
jgi:hypothetical protein